MNNPYIVGRWVRGSEHYDRQSNRQALTEYLLHAQDTAIWVMGARRMGKTSLLRQLEHLAVSDCAPHREGAKQTQMMRNQEDLPPLVPLFWDLQGCLCKEDLSRELFDALEENESRLIELGVEIEDLAQMDATGPLRRLNRRLHRAGCRLLLLIDEAEVLIEIAQQDAAWLARLRKVLQEGHQRTIIASTKLLTTMTEQSTEWVTSPFLFGFRLVNLHALDRESATRLVHQDQARQSVQVHSAVLDQILYYTNGHPYFIQWLCARLFVPLSDGQGYLRDIQENDLLLDPLMSALFRYDFTALNSVERRVLLTIAKTGRSTLDAVLVKSEGDAQPASSAVLQGLEEFGHLRRADGLLEIGNEFMYRWLRTHLDSLWAELEAESRDTKDEPATQGDEIEQLARLLGISSDRIRTLVDFQISSNEEFFRAIQGFFIQIRHIVEQDDGYRLLLTTDELGKMRLRSEDEVQIAFKHLLRPMCRALNIHMDREPLTGRGLLDFKFSLGHDFRCLVEVKLFHSSRLQEGLAIQLPIYLLADHAENGLYVPIFLKSIGYAPILKRLSKAAEEQAQSHGLNIKVVDIRAWKPTPASRADTVGDFDRYRLPTAKDDAEDSPTDIATHAATHTDPGATPTDTTPTGTTPTGTTPTGTTPTDTATVTTTAAITPQREIEGAPDGNSNPPSKSPPYSPMEPNDS